MNIHCSELIMQSCQSAKSALYVMLYQQHGLLSFCWRWFNRPCWPFKQLPYKWKVKKNQPIIVLGIFPSKQAMVVFILQGQVVKAFSLQWCHNFGRVDSLVFALNDSVRFCRFTYFFLWIWVALHLELRNKELWIYLGFRKSHAGIQDSIT
jgi:hypothetical protein